jgi:hypothetical protein
VTNPSPLLALPGVVAVEEGPDVGVPLHHGDPQAEQRSMDRAAAVVDRSHRELIAVPGEDRLSWLHLLLTQHVSELPADSGTEALVLDINGRVQQHAVLAHVGDTVWLDTEPGRGAELLGYLESMRFWSKVEPREASGELAVLTVIGPDTAEVLTRADVPVPDPGYGVAGLPGGGLARRMPGLLTLPRVPGGRPLDEVDLLVPRAELVAWWTRLREAGAAAAGIMAHEAMRVGGLRPRLGLDTDQRTIPHEVGWIGSAVHLAKGCYRGQETVARVVNLGRPPRRLVLLHLGAGDEELPTPGDPVTADGRTVGRVGTAVLHHDLGGVALALVKRSVPVEAELLVGSRNGGADGESDARPLAPARIDPDSMEQDSMEQDNEREQRGRLAQIRAGRAR